MTHAATETLPAARTSYGFAKVYLGGEVCKWLSILKGRLQMEEGPIARLALCTSLGEPFAPDLTLIEQEHGKTFPVAALAGPPQISMMLFAFLRQRMHDDGLDPGNPVELERQFKAHLSRGMLTMGVRVKHLTDVGRILEEAQERFRVKHPAQAGTDLDTPDAASTMGQTHVSSVEDTREGPTATTEPPFPTTRGTPAVQESAPPVEQAITSIAEGEVAHEMSALSLWGALLPAPVAHAGRKGSARKKRGVARRRKKRRFRR